MKKIISFSLWGGNALYNEGAIANAHEAKEVYPDWKCRFYVHDKSPMVSRLMSLDCEVITMTMGRGWTPLYWRFYAASDRTVGYCLFRDCDSRVNTREAAAVAEWIRSGKNAHLMKDYPAPHARETILAGMWGIRGGVIRDMEQLVRAWVARDDISNKYTDQNFLRVKIWPLIRDSVLNHGVDSPAGKAIPFPPHKAMKYGEYVGQPINP